MVSTTEKEIVRLQVAVMDENLIPMSTGKEKIACRPTDRNRIPIGLRIFPTGYVFGERTNAYNLTGYRTKMSQV